MPDVFQSNDRTERSLRDGWSPLLGHRSSLPGGAAHCLTDLALDHVRDALEPDAADPHGLRAIFEAGYQDAETVDARQAVFLDLADTSTMTSARSLFDAYTQLAHELTKAQGLESRLQGDRGVLEAYTAWGSAVEAAEIQFREMVLESEGLRALRDALSGAIHSETFQARRADAARVRDGLESVLYDVLLQGSRVTVSAAGEETDLVAAIGGVRHDLGDPARPPVARRRPSTAMNWVESSILDRVSQIFEAPFAALRAFVEQHGGRIDAELAAMVEDLRWFLRYDDVLIAAARRANLAMVLPQIDGDRMELRSTFDAALLLISGTGPHLVVNDVVAERSDHTVVITGPNQGGKSTMARAIGQAHYLGNLGCPVPGSQAVIRRCGAVLTHFEREEAVADLRSRFEDDVARIHAIVQKSDHQTVVILNELFSSTTTAEGASLTRDVLRRLRERGAFSVCVTFFDEVAAGPGVVSLVAEVAADDLAHRTYRLVARRADGRAYAASLARRHGLGRDEVAAAVRA